jgi:hypothetical protein
MGNSSSHENDSQDDNTSAEAIQPKSWGETEILVDDSDIYRPPQYEEDPEVSEGCCRIISNDLNYVITPSDLSRILELLSKTRTENVECTINELRNAGYHACKSSSQEILNDNERANVLDCFLRGRHENLSTYACKCFGFAQDSTDVEFCEILPIASKRTPDYILKISEKVVLIVEVTAVSDSEKGAIAKGLEDKGYKSKYETEILELQSLGFTVNYAPIIFDMSERTNVDHRSGLEKISKVTGVVINESSYYDLEVLRKEYIALTSIMNSQFSDMYNNLFGKKYSIKGNSSVDCCSLLKQGSSCYKGSYKRVGISSTLYDKVNSLWPRMERMIERSMGLKGGNRKYILTFEASTSRFKFEEDWSHGATQDDWLEAHKKNWKVWVCQHLKYKVNKQVISVPKSDYEFFDYSNDKDVSVSKIPAILLYREHRMPVSAFDGIPCKDIVSEDDFTSISKYVTIFDDEKYESSLVSGIKSDFDGFNEDKLDSWINKRQNKPLAHYKVNRENFEVALKGFIEAQSVSDVHEHSQTMFKVKQPFVYPLMRVSASSYSKYTIKPEILGTLKNMNLGPYTNKIIMACNDPAFSFGTKKFEGDKKLTDLRNQLAELSRERGGRMKRKEIDKKQAKEIYGDRISSLQRDFSKRSRELGISQGKIGVVRIMDKSRNLESSFKQEMQHFKVKGAPSSYSGVGNKFDPDFVRMSFNKLLDDLLNPAEVECQDMIYDERTSFDCNLLREMKEKSIDNNKGFYKYLRCTNMYNSCAFISRLCHTLLYASQTSLNNDWVTVDNLGYSDVLLMVRGGKKIFPTKKTKMFKIIYPTYPICASIYGENTQECDFSFFEYNGRAMIMTPWMNFNETVVVDGLTSLHRLMGFALLNQNPEFDNDFNLRKVSFNIMLSLHNRRKTEAVFHNLRYIMMNCMSELSAIPEMLKEAAGFNYDYFQCWVRDAIRSNFLNFAISMKEMHDCQKPQLMKEHLSEGRLKHLITEQPIVDFESLATAVYSTYLMSKAPVNQTLEQVSNLTSMMTTHMDFLKRPEGELNYRVVFEGNFGKYYDELFSSDFCYDPKYCNLLGKFMSDYMCSIESRAKASQKWDQILDSNWDEFANTKGLRYKGDDFFGNKGYYVVYKEILNSESFGNEMAELLDIIDSGDTEQKKRKRLDCLNKSFRSRIASVELEMVVMHVVDKLQRSGSREIYVMDLETKVHQQVIEKYMSYLCKLVPNELISIPSNKRLSTIHSRVFEEARDVSNHHYWVLDCRKWAPKSLIEKFIIFLVSAKGFFPPTFIRHCINFFKKATEKRIYTRKPVFEVFSKSKNNDKSREYFVPDEAKNGYYFQMPYSWVMGIFNFFSSFFHVACQLHASHLIRLSLKELQLGDSILHMMAHSDDSAGRFQCEDERSHRLASVIYETMMHGGNHLISRKKSCKGKTYFELLSVLYIGGELLTLLDKFVGIFNFHPTDKGYCSDITEAYSKCIEIILNGGTFEQSYISMKIQSDLIKTFYFQRGRSINDYNYPPQMYGMPDAHPLMVLLLGSESDVFRIMHYGTEDDLKIMVSVNEVLATQTDDVGLFKQFNMIPNVELNNKLKRLKNSGDEFERKLPDEWPMNHVNFGNTALNTLQFLKKLNDKHFVAALQDETVVRRISRSYYGRSHMTTQTKYGPMDPKMIRELISHLSMAYKGEALQENEMFSNMYDELKSEVADIEKRTDYYKKLANLLYSEPIGLCDYMNRLSMSDKEMEMFSKTCKPAHINIAKTVGDVPVKFEVNSLLAWIKYPKYRFMLKDTRGYWTAQTFVEDILRNSNMDINEVTDQQLFAILNKVRNKTSCEYFCYSNVPSNLRDINSYQDVLNFLAHNSFKNTFIKGLTLRFGKTITVPDERVMPDLSDPEFRMVVTFLLILNALIRSTENDNLLWDLDVNWCDSMMTLKEAWSDLVDKWSKHRLAEYILPQILSVECALEGKDYIPSEKFKDCYYHCFTRRQFLVNNVWLGVGKLFISAGNFKAMFLIRNTGIESVSVLTNNYMLKKSQVEYINLSLKQSQLPSLVFAMSENDDKFTGNDSFGTDHQGNYVISSDRDLSTKMKTFIVGNFDDPITEFERGVVKPHKRGRFRWYCNIEGKTHSHLLSTLSIEPSEALSLMDGLIVDNTRNRNLIAALGGDMKNVLVNMCHKDLDLELNIDMNSILKAPRMSELYKILRHCRKRKIANTNPKRISPTHEPAPEGGLLNCLISYSIDNPSFDFNWQHVTTPEYMQLKSVQPGNFMTELADGINEKYNSLYDSDDKASIMKSLLEVAKVVTGDVDEKKFKSLMCTWGYIGVSGALSDMESEKSAESFKSVRLLSITSPYINVSNDAFFWLIKCMFNSMEDHLKNRRPIHMLTDFGDFSNVKNFTREFLNLANTISQDCYSNGQYFDILDQARFLVPNIFYTLINDDETRQFFTLLISHNHFLRQLPIGGEHLVDWIISFNVLRMNFTSYRKINRILDYNTMIDRFEDVERPKAIAEEMLKYTTLKMPARAVAHHGMISPSLLEQLRCPKKVIYNGRKTRFTFSLADLSKQPTIPFSTEYFFNSPLTEEFLESDEWEEAKYELSCNPPDEDEINSQIEAYGADIFVKEDYKNVRIVERGRMVTVLSVEFSVVLMFNSMASPRFLSRIRNLGHNIILVTNFYLYKTFKKVPGVLIFNDSKPTPPGDLNSKNNYHYIVITNRYSDSRFWEETMGWKLLTHEELESRTFVDCFSYRSMTGNLVNDFKGENDMKLSWYKEVLTRDQNVMESNLKLELPTADESVSELTMLELRKLKLEKIVDKLKDYGFDKDQIWHYKNLIKEGDKNDKVEQILDVFKTYLEGKGGKDVTDKVKNMFSNLVKSPLTPLEQEMIFQVPLVFGGGKRRDVFQKSNILRDQKLIAEIESICPGIIWKIISGTFRISNKYVKRWQQQFVFYNSYVEKTSVDLDGKKMFLRIIMMLLNDAKPTKEGDEDRPILEHLMDTANRVILDQVEETDPEEFFDEDVLEGSYNYQHSGWKVKN